MRFSSVYSIFVALNTTLCLIVTAVICFICIQSCGAAQTVATTRQLFHRELGLLWSGAKSNLSRLQFGSHGSPTDSRCSRWENVFRLILLITV